MKRYGLVGLTHPFRGGIAHYTSSLYLSLARHHQVHLYSYRRQYPRILFPGKTQLDQSSQALLVPNEPILDPLAPWTWIRATRAISRYRPDVVLVMWWNPFFAPMLAFVAKSLSGKDRLPVVFLCHNVLPHENTALDRWLLRLAYRSPTHFLVQSEVERRNLLEIRPGAPVRVVHHPAQSFFQSSGLRDRQEARRVLTAKGILPSHDFASDPGASSASRRVLLFFGHVRRYKGVDILLQALPKVLRQIPVELLLAGEFYDSRDKYDALVQDLGLQRAVRIVDRYILNEEVSLFFEAADVVILPYRSGTQSAIVPLAYQFERPVIVSRVGGIPEAVEEGRTGLLVNPEDPDSLAAAIYRFFTENLSQVFAPHLRPAAERLSWSALVAKIDAFLSDDTLRAEK